MKNGKKDCYNKSLSRNISKNIKNVGYKKIPNTYDGYK